MLIKYALIVHYYGLIVNNIVHFFLSFFLTGRGRKKQGGDNHARNLKWKAKNQSIS
nr:MAG TPA: hypothetical protein [Caudoviricetes sp.]